MKKLFFGLSMMLSIFLIQSCSGGNSSDTSKDSVDSAKTVNKEVKAVEKDASDFAVKAADGGMMEVEAGRIAQKKGVSERVKNFGAMMIKDHMEANNNLKGIASSLNVALPDSLGKDAKDDIEKLSKKSGKDFDKAYVDMMLDDHQKDVAEFRKAADNLSDSTIREFARKTLPVLETHLDSIRSIAGKK
jgi:putative membrane protein